MVFDCQLLHKSIDAKIKLIMVFECQLLHKSIDAKIKLIMVFDCQLLHKSIDAKKSKYTRPSLLTHSMPLVSCQMFSGGIERDQWHEIRYKSWKNISGKTIVLINSIGFISALHWSGFISVRQMIMILYEKNEKNYSGKGAYCRNGAFVIQVIVL